MLSPTNDPYYVARDDVAKQISKVREMQREWRKLLHDENTTRCSRFQELHTNISSDIGELDVDLRDIGVTINVVEENRERFHLDDAEVRIRKEFVRQSRVALKEIRDEVIGRAAQAKIEQDKRLALQQNSSGAQRGSSMKNSRVSKENAEYLEVQKQEQQYIKDEQDETLIELSQSAQRLGHIAISINKELEYQQPMLELLSKDVDKETEKLNFVMKRVGRLLKTSDNKLLCLAIGLFILFLVLLFLVINV